MAEQQSRSMTGAEWTMPLILSALWGSSFFFCKVLSAQLPPFSVVLGRVAWPPSGLRALHVATGQISGATLVMLPIAAITERFWTLPPPTVTVWGAFAGIALLCTVLAYVLYFRILATAGATNLMLVTFLLPISALLLGSLILGEHMQPRAFMGMALIGAALAAIDGRAIAAVRLRTAKT